MNLPVTALGALLAAWIGVVFCDGQTSGDPVSRVPSATLVPAPGSSYLIPPQAQAIAAGGFNGTGLPDLVVSTADGAMPGGITIFLATTAGQFVPAPDSPLTVGFDHESLAIADFNRDGHLDIASLGQNDLAVFLGDGKGGFSLDPATPIDIPAFGVAEAENSMAVADFNGDGKPDLVLVSTEGRGDILILLGDGTGNFAPAPGSPMHTGYAARQVLVADFNGDGHPDLAITDEFANQVDVLLGDGTGRFSTDPKGPFPTAGQGPLCIASGDFNRDGFVDLAVTSVFAPNLTILLGDGDGGFTSEPVTNFGLNMSYIAAGDIDGDGILDLAIATAQASTNDGLLILLGDGRGGFQMSGSGVLRFLSPGPVTLADFNGDGRLDAAVAGSTLSVALGAATASSSLALSGSANAAVGAPLSIAVAAATSGFRAPTGQVTVRDGTTVVGSEELVDGSAAFRVTPATAGTHSYVAVYLGDGRTTGSASSPLTIDVALGGQSITFPPVPNYTYGDAPFSVSASSSAGLPVTITVVSGPGTIAGSLLTLTGPGTVTLRASQSGNANYLPAPAVQQQFQVAPSPLRIAAVVNAASYNVGALAPASFGVVFGADLASLATAGVLTSSLGGAGVQITDSSGKTNDADLYFASPIQINFLLPSNLSAGAASLTVQTQAGPSTTIGISIAPVGPGLFSADASGTGVAAGGALRVSADGTQTQLPISSCGGTPVTCTAIPIDLGSASDTVYLSLYGTGIRGRSALSAVFATVGGTSSSVQYAGAQPDFPGLDQVNVVISPTLRGSGVVPIVLSVDRITANAVTVAIE